jgi:threonine aldolase
LAAAGIYALDHQVERLQTDHEHACLLGEALEKQNYVQSVMPVDTNIVIFEIDVRLPADEFVAKMAANGVKCSTFGHQMVRFVTHLDISPEMVTHTIQTLQKIS